MNSFKNFGNMLRMFVIFCIYRIEFTGEKSISGRAKYVFKPRFIPMLIFSLFVVIPIVFFRSAISVFTDSYEEIRKVFRVQNYSSFAKKEGETKMDLYKRF